MLLSAGTRGEEGEYFSEKSGERGSPEPRDQNRAACGLNAK